jgi:DNA-directed RNA polymerase specialized sigma24 family protein
MEVFRAEYETLLRAMYLVTGHRYEAAERAQDAFVKACERWDRMRGMNSPIGYLYRTAVNTHKSSFGASGPLRDERSHSSHPTPSQRATTVTGSAERSPRSRCGPVTRVTIGPEGTRPRP